MMVCVRPGVLLIKASSLRPIRAFSKLDFPTLLLPKKAISGKPSEGNCSGLAEDVTKVLSITKSCQLTARGRLTKPGQSRHPAGGLPR